MLVNIGTMWSSSRATGEGVASGAAILARGESQALALDFTDSTFYASTGYYGSAFVLDTGTPANNYNTTPDRTASSLLTYTSPSAKMTMGPAGTLRFAAHNLCTYSEDFSNANWSKASSGGLTAASSGITPPTGATAVYLLTADAVNGYHLARNTASTVSTLGAVRYTFCAKAQTYSRICFREDFVSGEYAAFLLSGAGSIITSSGGSNKTITSLGDGWYECGITVTGQSGQSIGLYVLNDSYTTGDPSSYTYTGTGSAGVYVTKVHMRREPVDSTYLKTTTARYSLPLEWSSASVLQGLLCEEARTNLLTYSNTFSNAAWSKSLISDSTFSTTTTGPDGVATSGAKLTENTTNGQHIVFAGITKAASALAYTATIYAKAAERTRLMLFALNGGNTAGAKAVYDLSGGQIGVAANGFGVPFTSLSSSIVSVGSGWYRCVLSFTTDTDTSLTIRYELDSGVGTGAESISYAGTNGNGVYIHGAQLELGSSSSSMIPTVASTVTRAADNISLATTAFPHSATVGTIYAEFIAPSTSSGGLGVYACNVEGVTNESAGLYWLDAEVGGGLFDAGSVLANPKRAGYNTGGTLKAAMAFELNNTNGAFGGTLGTLDTGCTMPTMTRLSCGGRDLASQGATLKKLLYLPRRAPDAELVTKTT